MKSLLLLALFVGTAFARPPLKSNQGQPSQPETVGKPAEGGNGTQEWDLGIEYNRYLQEIVQVLESDPDFRKKLEDADVEKIRDGSIADELDFVHHNVRNQLDDIKRRELERLRHLAVKRFEMAEGIDKKHMKMPGHLEIQVPTFEKEDLKKLIKSTTDDLEEADKKRREEFKTYEMEKKFEKQERLNHIEDEEKRKEEEKKLQEMEEKHKKHAKPHHPMTKDQLEEVWEEQDHMRAEDWDPKTFFAMHDLNGDNVWDEDEVRMLFKKELDKVYDPNAPEDDMREREEEMERMREHVFKESDKNKDRLISYDEFLTETKRDEFGEDPGWETLDEDEQDDFSDDEFRAYEMQRQREIQDMLNRGIVPHGYPYYGDIPQGGHAFQPPQPGQQHLPSPGQPGYHPQQGMGVPQGFPNQQPQLGIPGQPAYHPQQGGGQQQQHPGQFGQQGGAQPQPGQLSQQQAALKQQQESLQAAQHAAAQHAAAQQHAQAVNQAQMHAQQTNQGSPQFNQQPGQGQPIQGQPIQGQPIQGQPIQGQPIQGQPIQGHQQAQFDNGNLVPPQPVQHQQQANQINQQHQQAQVNQVNP